jgi:hypothetical protein
MCVYTGACMQACIFVLHVCMWVHACTCLCTCMCVCVCVCASVHVCADLCVYVPLELCIDGLNFHSSLGTSTTQGCKRKLSLSLCFYVCLHELDDATSSNDPVRHFCRSWKEKACKYRTEIHRIVIFCFPTALCLLTIRQESMQFYAIRCVDG